MEALGTVNRSRGVDNPVSCPDCPVIVKRLEVGVCSILHSKKCYQKRMQFVQVFATVTVE